ncbi:ATP synthase F1 subunit epsilon [Fusobacterium sp.]|jgi:F-type H+-transporting ATPase subunit epsilon|uniref:ATP synthase F1 subunit epsilon n=1 Tax=Fusobacterium sp. TaxID=68766 RepID=UPI0025DCA197|nr:ATP synthase F1 subunit epsilon [Fusobacterium sp.]MDY3059535.1 ATP synthase F1 subunit epsilon [Fusobacterium sp.]
MATFNVKVVTYQEKVLEQEADFLLVRTTEGDMGVLPNHSPFVAELAIGEMMIRLNGTEKSYFVSGGFLEISNNNVTILADEAMASELIDLERAKKEAEEAKAKLEKLKEDKDILMTEKNLNAALTKVRLAEKLL